MLAYAKKSKKGATARKGGRAKFTPRLLKGVIKRTINPWSPSQTYCFERFAQDGNLIVTAASTSNIYDASNSSVGWAALGATNADVGGFGVMQQGLTCAFRMDDLPNIAALKSMFNEYRIDKIELAISIGMGDSYSAGGGQGSQLPTIYSVYDPNDASGLVSLPNAQRFANCSEHVLSQEKPWKRTLVCKPAIELFESAVTTAYALQANQQALWLDFNYTATPHYGFKFWLRGIPTTSGSGFVMRFQPRYYFSCRKPR